MPRRYVILDVFADRPLAGNPLAVVLDSDGLDAARMQAIAGEFGLSETVFVRPAANPIHSAALRIFTPSRELPFAGHPTVGTAVLLGLEKAAAGMDSGEMVIVLEEGVGPVRCGVSIRSGALGHAVFDMPKLPVAAPEPLPGRDAIAAALALLPLEVGFENHQPSRFDAGVVYTFVPVRDLDAIARASVNAANWQAAFGTQSVFLYCRQTTGHGINFHGRMFAPALGIPEDPATGSAIAAFAGVIARFDQPPGGSHRYTIEQGLEMGRPSLISLEVDMDGGAVIEGRIGGTAVVVARGELDA